MGRQMRATPARISRALRLVKWGLQVRARLARMDGTAWRTVAFSYQTVRSERDLGQHQGHRNVHLRDALSHAKDRREPTPRLECRGKSPLPSTGQRWLGNLGFLWLKFHLLQLACSSPEMTIESVCRSLLLAKSVSGIDYTRMHVLWKYIRIY